MYPELLNDIERITANAKSVDTGFATLLDRFATSRPECDPALLRSLDVGADASLLGDWFRRLLAAEPPSSDIATIYFGLVEMKPAGTQDRLWTLYACGFLAGREPGPSPKWWPEGRYAESRVLSAISERLQAWPGDARLDAEYALVLGYALLVGRSLAKTAGIPNVETFVGFDEGDLYAVSDNGRKKE